MSRLSYSRKSFRFNVFEPKSHAHIAIHRRGGGEVLLRLLALGRPAIKLFETEVAVRL